MTDTWQRGDLALCIKQGNWRLSPTGEELDTGPRAGQILPVFIVGRAQVMELGKCVMLGFKAWPNDRFVAERFVKIDPHQLDEEEEEETIRLLKGQPAEASEDANGSSRTLNAYLTKFTPAAWRNSGSQTDADVYSCAPTNSGHNADT